MRLFGPYYGGVGLPAKNHQSHHVMCAVHVLFSTCKWCFKRPDMPSRGIRQGDPLSLYLFLCCTNGTEGLVSFFHKSAFDKGLQGIRICRGAPKVNYFLSVDHSLIFYRTTYTDSQLLMDILQTYAKASGQCINKGKTTMVFSNITCERDKEAIQTIWGIRGQQ